MKARCTLCRVILPDHIGNAVRKLRLHFLLGQSKTVLVIDGDLLALHNL